MHNRTLFPKVAILAVAILWGSSFAFQKGLLESINPTTFTFYNFSVTGILFLLYSIYKKRSIFYRIKEGIILGFLVTGMELFQMYGLHLSSAANTSFISNLGMLLIPFLGYIVYRHKVTKVDSVALFGAGVGMYFLVGGIHKIYLGDIFLLVSAFFMAYYFLMSQRFEAESGGHLSVLCAQQFIIVGVVTGVIMGLNGFTFSIQPTVLTNFIIQIFVFTTLPYALIQWSSQFSNEMMVSMYDGVVEPLVGGIVAWIFFSEATSTSQVLGGLGMVLAFGVSVVYNQKHSLLKEYKKFTR